MMPTKYLSNNKLTRNQEINHQPADVDNENRYHRKADKKT